MKQRWLSTTLLVLVVILVSCEPPAQTVQVVFRVLPDTLPDSSRIFLSGNQDLLGNWQPAGHTLIQQPDGAWQTTLPFSRNTTVAFKVTRGTWPSEAVLADGSVPGNHTLTTVNDTTLVIKVANWRDLSDPPPPPARQVTGVVRYHRNFHGKEILPRDIIVWLPPGYETEKAMRYPVLYAHDGQNLFDPTTAFTGYDWRIDEVADSLIRAGTLNPVIVVGINNTGQRFNEYRDTPLGQAYMRFIVTELKPFIDATYRTRPGPHDTGNMGSSQGGEIAFLIAWQYPEIVSMAACLSPSFVLDREKTRRMVANSPDPKKDIRIYIDYGTAEVDSLQRASVAMGQTLIRSGYRMGSELLEYTAPGAAHNERHWARRVWRPLMFMFGKN